MRFPCFLIKINKMADIRGFRRYLLTRLGADFGATWPRLDPVKLAFCPDFLSFSPDLFVSYFDGWIKFKMLNPAIRAAKEKGWSANV